MLKRAKEKAERAAAEMAAKAQAAADAAMLAASGEPDHDPFDVAPADDDGEADGPAPGIAERLAVLTADDDSMPDQQIMAAMVQVASAGQPHEISELAQAVAERLASPSATVQNKLLRTTLQLCQRGTVEFRELLQHLLQPPRVAPLRTSDDLRPADLNERVATRKAAMHAHENDSVLVGVAVARPHPRRGCRGTVGKIPRPHRTARAAAPRDLAQSLELGVFHFTPCLLV
jgi:hypothetical protein